jgi:hypothetical protein
MGISSTTTWAASMTRKSSHIPAQESGVPCLPEYNIRPRANQLTIRFSCDLTKRGQIPSSLPLVKARVAVSLKHQNICYINR